jgi:hypothetical protein
MLYLLNARRGYRATSPAEITAGALSLTNGSDAQGVLPGLRGGDRARVAGLDSTTAHDLTTIVFERSRLRKNEPFGTSNWLESGLSDEGEATRGDAIAAGNAQKTLDRGAASALTTVDSDGKPSAHAEESEVTEREKDSTVDPSDSVRDRSSVRSLSHVEVRISRRADIQGFRF